MEPDQPPRDLGLRGGAVDVAAAALGVVLCVLLGLAGQPDWAWSAAMAATLGLRRTAPVACAAVATVVSVAHLLAEAAPLFPGDLVLLAAAYSVAAYADGRRRRVAPVMGLVVVGVLAASLPARGVAPAEGALAVGLVGASLVVAWVVGLLRRRTLQALHDAEHRRLLSERNAQARSQLAAYEERERINDEMHDVLAHTLTSVVVQAESGRAIAASGEVADLFETISRTGRSALGEVRVLLAPSDQEGAHPALLGLAPGLDDLDDLLAGVEASGQRVERRTTGTPVGLDPGLSAAVYRVVQESLTNAQRHGTGDTVRLTLDWAPDQLRVTVSNAVDEPADPGAADASLREHRGLAGIRRRCRLYGGSLHYGFHHGTRNDPHGDPHGHHRTDPSHHDASQYDYRDSHGPADTFTLVATWPLTVAAETATGVSGVSTDAPRGQ
ncbi:sensor histidine kinase [Actinomyces wuliandei]|uniref:sensor histidine kinase n=1 Tax=Actinomyces wuliandei TaxID=2057743 RepID=UPI000FDC3CF3|nr:histidine kinase [Actinomyces wuliandei]